MAKLVSNNTYSNILQVSWNESNRYIKVGKIIKDPITGERHTIRVWVTRNSEQPATSGYYLNIDEISNSTYIVQLYNRTFNADGSIIGDLNSYNTHGAIFKLPSDFNFQDNVFYYLKNGNNFEGLKVNQGQCTFTTDPETDNNFYIYQKGIEPWTSAAPLPRLVYYDRGTKYYYPLIKPTSTLTWNDYIYSYDKSVGDTFGIGLSNTKYVVPNKRVAAQTYDIPAGTYTPSAFKNLIQKFISLNGSRAVSNSFKVTVNGQTLSLAAGTTIYYTTQGSSPWYAEAVGFGERYFQVASCMDKTGFTNYKSYIVETSNSNSYPNSYCFNYVFRYYASFNITVETSIKFE